MNFEIGYNYEGVWRIFSPLLCSCPCFSESAMKENYLTLHRVLQHSYESQMVRYIISCPLLYANKLARWTLQSHQHFNNAPVLPGVDTGCANLWVNSVHCNTEACTRQAQQQPSTRSRRVTIALCARLHIKKTYSLVVITGAPPDSSLVRIQLMIF